MWSNFTNYFWLVGIFECWGHTWIRRMNFRRLRMCPFLSFFSIRWKGSSVVKFIGILRLLLSLVSGDKVVDSDVNNIAIDTADEGIFFIFVSLLKIVRVLFFILLWISFEYWPYFSCVIFSLLSMWSDLMSMTGITNFLN